MEVSGKYRCKEKALIFVAMEGNVCVREGGRRRGGEGGEKGGRGEGREGGREGESERERE